MFKCSESYHGEECRQQTFESSQKVLLNHADLDVQLLNKIFEDFCLLSNLFLQSSGHGTSLQSLRKAYIGRQQL